MYTSSCETLSRSSMGVLFGLLIRTSKDISILESVQCRAARWIKSKYDNNLYKWTKSSDVCLEELCWPTLELRRRYLTIIMIHSILHKQTPINPTSHFKFNTLDTRSHSLCKLYIPQSRPSDIHSM